ncbi:MAG TPA: hypothetical protein VF258_11990, partial [Luteolibacter sp.]
IVRNSEVEALVIYLNQGGDVATLLADPVNQTKYMAVMKDVAFRYNCKPRSPHVITVQNVAGLVESLNKEPSEFGKRWFLQAQLKLEGADGLSDFPKQD